MWVIKSHKGQVEYNGNNILDDKVSYFDLIGYVSQNIFLIDDSLKNNIVLGNQEFNLDKFNNAIKLANLNETLKSMTLKKILFWVNVDPKFLENKNRE